MPNKDLEGKIAVVTGAGSGIGAGISKILHDRGAKLALCDLFGESAEKIAKSLSDDYLFDSVDVTKLIMDNKHNLTEPKEIETTTLYFQMLVQILKDQK